MACEMLNPMATAGKNTPCCGCIFPHTHSWWDPPAVSGREYTPVTGYTSSLANGLSLFEERDKRLWLKR